MKRSLLMIFIDYYLPGYKAGGPIQSVKALVDLLKSTHQIVIVTRNHDFKSDCSYEITPNKLYELDGVGYYYLSKEKQTLKFYRKLLKKHKPSIVYLNSFFSWRYSVLVVLGLFLQRINIKLILAPRGEFAQGALQIKSFKKYLFLKLARFLYKKVIFQATSLLEKKNILRCFPRHQVIMAPNLITFNAIDPAKKSVKQKDQLKLVFLSRISRKKNLDGVLKLLQQCDINLSLDIYGPLEDARYWQQCQQLIASLPENVVVRYKGEVKHHEVAEVFAKYDIFIFLTLGENFGHVILEAMATGCPAILSDQVPWRDIEEHHAGWNFPLSAEMDIIAKLKMLATLDAEQFQSWVDGAKAYANHYADQSANKEMSLRLFQ